MEFPRRSGIAVAATVAVLACGAFVADTVVASRSEVVLSEWIRSVTPGVPAPAVTVGGGPAARWSGAHSWPSVSIRVEGVERPVVGPVTVSAEATDVTLPPDDAENPADPQQPGDTGPPTAGAVTVSVQITADALGRALDMRDVLLSAADDPSLAGGTEHRARITGTVPGPGEGGGDDAVEGTAGDGAAAVRVSVFVDLVVDDDGAHLVPVAPATGPAGIPDQDTGTALARTALTLPADLLPLGLDIETLTIRGGTLTATGTADTGTTPLDGLARPAH